MKTADKNKHAIDSSHHSLFPSYYFEYFCQLAFHDQVAYSSIRHRFSTLYFHAVGHASGRTPGHQSRRKGYGPISPLRGRGSRLPPISTHNKIDKQIPYIYLGIIKYMGLTITTITFVTLKFANTLKAADVPPEQAEA